MASSKASMLKSGAKKASKGLFTGMQKLSEIEAAKEEKTPEKAVEKVEEKTAEKKAVEKTVETKADAGQKESEALHTEESNVIETQEIVKEQSQTVVESHPSQPVVEKNAEVEADNRPEQSISPQPINTDATAHQNVDTQPANVQFTESIVEPIQSIETQQQLSQQPNNQAVTAPEMNFVQPSVQQTNYQQAPVQQAPVQQPVQPSMQQMPQNVVYSQPQVSNVAPQQPVYNQQYAPSHAERTYESQYSQPVYAQPAMNYPQQQFNQPVHEAQSSAPRAAKTAKQEKNSRYEKDKFLLLDIRGYRDYVEHMAKAANMSATKYIRNLIEQDMRVNHDIYEEQKRLEEMFKGRI